MKFPLSWFKEILPTQLSVEKVADGLTQIGLEVEGIDTDSLPNDAILEVALTPNLGHCASVIGMARELSALTKELIETPQIEVQEQKGTAIEDHVQIQVDEPQLCPRYSCRLIRGVTVGPSPNWLKVRIEACGLRSVNNVVDVTNYVLLEFGHPLHAFDFDTLEGGQIIVRLAKKQESITTLDGKKHFPTEKCLLIADAKKAVAVAGVMGSAESEVTEKTQNVLLEAAVFEPTQVRRSSKRMNLKTDASRHFERGVDPNGTLTALNRAAALITKISGGEIVRGVIDVKPHEFPKKRLSVRTKRVNDLLGTNLSMSEIETMLERLKFILLPSQEGTVEVEIPTYRVDIHGEIDLIEEVARMYGFDNLTHEIALTYREGELSHSPLYLFEKTVRRELINQGLQEFVTSNLISKEQASLISTMQIPSRSLIHILNPISSDQSVLRPSLLPSLLQVIKKNHDHSLTSVQGFEVGRIHFTTKEKMEESSVASIVMTGKRAPYHFDPQPSEVDFFDLKGLLENLFEAINVQDITFTPSNHANFHPKRQAELNIANHVVGIMGQVHPKTLAKMGLECSVFFAELDLTDLVQRPSKEKKYHPLPRFPASSRDLTLTLKEDCPIEWVLSTLKEHHYPLLESICLLDVYRSEKLGSEWKNITFRFVYRDQNETVSFETIEKSHRQITDHLIEKSDWVKRG